MLDHLFAFIKYCLQLPFELWQEVPCKNHVSTGTNFDYGCTGSESHKLEAIGVAIVELAFACMALIVIKSVIIWVRDKYVWFHNRRPCIHCKDYTLQRSQSSTNNCRKGAACCQDCNKQHRLDAEIRLDCPSCDTRLVAFAIGDQFAQRCPNCGMHCLSQTSYEQLSGVVNGVR